MRRRSPQAELAERVNVAHSLLKEGSSRDEVLSVIVDRFGISRRQAYRYVEEALRIKHTVPVPERKVVFTVKVPSATNLIRIFQSVEYLTVAEDFFQKEKDR